MEDNSDIHTQANIINHTYCFFKKLFSANHHKSFSTYTRGKVCLSKINKTDLKREPLEEEIKNAIFSFDPFKALYLDGLHPFFYQR